jgi:hypothetical protein
MAIALLPTYTPSIEERFRKSLVEGCAGRSCRVGESNGYFLKFLPGIRALSD